LDGNPNFQDPGFKLVHVAKDQSSELWGGSNSVDWGDFEVLLNHQSNSVTSERLNQGLKTYLNPECKFGYVFMMLDSENQIVGLVSACEEYSE